MQQKQQIGVEVVEYNETAGYFLVKLPVDRLDCGITLTPTLFPVRTRAGVLYDADIIKGCDTEPTLHDVPLKQEDVRPDILCAEISMALFKKAPQLFEINEKFPVWFERGLMDNDVALVKALIVNAVSRKMTIDATALLLAAYKQKRTEIFAFILVEVIEAKFPFDHARIRAILSPALKQKQYEWLMAISEYLNEKEISIANYFSITGINEVLLGNTPLYWSCHLNLLALARNLLDFDASQVNTLSGMGRDDTPLCVAARNGNATLVRALIEKKADINLPGLNRLTPFLTAIAAGKNELLPIFAQNQALDWTVLDEDYCSAMNIACVEESVESLRFLLDNVPKQQQKFLLSYAPQHRTLLGMAIKEDSACALLLIERGTGLFSLSSGKSPLTIARSNGDKVVEQAIENYYLTHINEMMLLLLNPLHDTEALMSDWLHHKQVLFDHLSGYVKTLLQGDHHANSLNVLRSALNETNNPKSVLQKYFGPLNFLDRFRSNPWPDKLSDLGKEVEAVILAKNDDPALCTNY